jgi:hypothetical protein
MLVLAFSECRQQAVITRTDISALFEAAAKVAGPTTTGDALCQKLSKRRKEILLKDAELGEKVCISISVIVMVQGCADL